MPIIQNHSGYDFAVWNQMKFPPLGYCMYCKATEDLTKEHSVPYALGSPAFIPKSSCKQCAKITGRFEQDVLRGPLRPIRAALGFKTRRPKQAPHTARLSLIRGDQEFTVDLPLSEHPLLLTFLTFAPPRLVTGKQGTGIDVRGHVTISFGKPVQEILDKFKADSFKAVQAHKPVSFARMIGKIGWATAAAEGHIERLSQNNSVVGAMMYQPNQIGEWVGTYTDPLVDENFSGHTIVIREHRGLLLADIKLFASSPTPKYGVILGHLK